MTAVAGPSPAFPTGAFIEEGDTVVLHRDYAVPRKQAEALPTRAVAGGLVTEIRIPNVRLPSRKVR